MNPAAAVRGPKARRHEGRDAGPLGGGGEELLEHIDTGALAGLRDRALFSVMLYSFARVSAVLAMRRQDYFGQGSRGWLRLHEKGGKAPRRASPPPGCRRPRRLRRGAELEEPKMPLFQTMDPAGRRLTGRVLDRRVALAMIKRRATAARLPPSTCCHTFRATAGPLRYNSPFPSMPLGSRCDTRRGREP